MDLREVEFMLGANASFLGWMDYSEHERRKMLDVIDLFSEQDTRDEMGIGTVRDAFADLFFPGTSTIQTRAGYFLFVPWMYMDLERRGVSPRDIAAKARREEIALIDVLARSNDPGGTIGLRAKASLKRIPSNVYWQGLETWGIRLFPGSQDQYHRLIGRRPSLVGDVPRDDDGEPLDGSLRPNWHPGIPSAPDGFPEGATFRLTRTEAEYLRERILTRVPTTLLAFLADRGSIWQPIDFPWEHPQFAEFPARIKEQLFHARNFSEAIHGSVLLYNLMLADLVGKADLIADYQERLRAWADMVNGRRDAMAQWDRRQFWQIVLAVSRGVPMPTRMFIEAWLDLALSAEAGAIAANQRARRLVHERERALKRDQARLDNQRTRELWSGEAGTAQLSYRWPVTQTIALDILNGLEVLHSHA